MRPIVELKPRLFKRSGVWWCQCGHGPRIIGLTPEAAYADWWNYDNEPQE